MDARVGDLFAVKLGPRRFGAAHVVWTQPEWGHVSLVALDGFFDRAPTFAEAEKLGVLQFQHLHYEGPFWVRILRGKKLPPFLSRVGRAPLPSAARAFPLGDTWDDPEALRRSTMWKAIPATLRREDHYRHDARYAKEVLGWARPGDVFAFPDNGEFTVCRLFRIAEPTQKAPNLAPSTSRETMWCNMSTGPRLRGAAGFSGESQQPPGPSRIAETSARHTG